MPELTAALLTGGTVLSLFGFLGFVLNWTTDPNPLDLIHARHTAQLGQAATLIGLLALVTSGHAVAGIALLAVLIAAISMVAAVATWAPLKHYVQAGYTPL